MNRSVFVLLLFITQIFNLYSQAKKQDRELQSNSKSQINTVSGGSVGTFMPINNPTYNTFNKKEVKYIDNSQTVNIYQVSNIDSIELRKKINEILNKFKIYDSYFKIVIINDNIYEKDISILISKAFDKFGLSNEIKILPVIIDKKLLDKYGGTTYYYSLKSEMNADALVTFSYDNITSDSSIYHLFSIMPDLDYRTIETNDIFNLKQAEIRYFWEDTIRKTSKNELFNCNQFESVFSGILHYMVIKENNIDSSLLLLNKFSRNQYFLGENYNYAFRIKFMNEFLKILNMCEGDTLIQRENLISKIKKYNNLINTQTTKDSAVEIFNLYSLLFLNAVDTYDNYKNEIERKYNEFSQHITYYASYITNEQILNIRKTLYFLLVKGINIKREPYSYITLLDKFNYTFDSIKFEPMELPYFIINEEMKYSPKNFHDAFMGSYYALSFDYHFFKTKNYDSMYKYISLITTLPDRLYNNDSNLRKFNYYNFFLNTYQILRILDFGILSYQKGVDSNAMNYISFYLRNNIIDTFNLKYYTKSGIEAINNYSKVLYKLRYKNNLIGNCFYALNLIYYQSKNGILEKGMVQDWIEIFKNSNEKLKSSPKEYLLVSNQFKELENNLKANK